jgi:hypothetical protein
MRALLALVAQLALAADSSAEPSPLVACGACGASPPPSQQWPPLAAGSVGIAISPPQSPSLCLQASATLGGVVCQGACVFLDSCASATQTTWNVSLVSDSPSQPGAVFVIVASAANPDVVGWRLAVSGGAQNLQLWPPNAICCALDQWVQNASRGFALYSGADKLQAACVADASTCCATSVAGAQCSGHGRCDTRTGVCACSGPCYAGADCAAFSDATCATNGGTCFADTGACLCGDACHSGALCDVPVMCSGLGTCNPGQGGCQCNDELCHTSTGSDCVPKDCGVGPNFCERGMCMCEAPGCTALDSGGSGKCVAVKDCGPHGSCQGGNCVCESACWTGELCDVPFCQNGGQCAPGSPPTCSCANDCFQLGPSGQCDQPRACGAFGSCARASC